jgi:insecticidal toxin complex protein TccC
MNIYDSANGRLRRSTATRQDRQALQDREYVYDPVGNVTQVQDRAIPVRYFRNRAIAAIDRYGYDSLGQLIQASGRESASAQIGPALPVLAPLPGTGEALSPYTQTYTYDAGGNLTQLHHQGAQVYTRTTAVARHSNRALVQVGDTPPDVEAGFDAHGNLLRLSPGGQALAWDGRQQLRQVTTLARADGSDDTEVYVYGGGGQRLRKVSQAQAQAVTHHHEVRYLPGLELHTRSGDEQWEVVIASGTRVLHWRAGRPPELPNDAFRYTLSDHLGSTVLELDADAALISAEGYYPYGSTAWWAGRHQVEASYKTIRYSGKERDATGLYYYGFRYYATWLQRWLNPDPAGEVDGLNLFRMAKNNPINFLDRSGLNGVDWLDLATGNVDDASIVAALYRAHPGLKERYGLFTGATSTIIKQAEVNTREINSTRSNAKQRKLAESFRFTEKKLQGYAAHAGVSAADGGAASYQSEFVNFPGGLSPKQLFPGVSIQQNKIKAGFEPYVPKSPPVSRQNSREESAPIREGVLSALEPGIGSYKIVDVDKFIGGVREKYQSEGRPLHSVTEHRIRKHIERNNFVLPIRAGIAGLHAEVQAFNAWVSAAESLPTKTEAPYYKLISESYIFTQRLVGDRGRDFPACHNCSGILSAPVNIMTGRVTNAAHTHTRTRRMST